MATNEILSAQKPTPAQLAREIQMYFQLCIDGLRVDDGALEGVGALYTEVGASLFPSARAGTPRLLPSAIRLPGGIIAPAGENQNSEYVLAKEDGQHVVKRGNSVITEVSLEPRPLHYGKKTADGTPMQYVLPSISRDCLLYTFATACQYDKHGGLCHFCNMNSSPQEHREQRPSPARTMRSLQAAVAEMAKDERLTHVFVSGGTMDEERQQESLLSVVRAFREALGADYFPGLVNQAALMDRQKMEALYQAGVRYVSFNQEIWNPKYFEAVCPGKAQLPGWHGWVQALKWAAEIFGPGHVSSCFVAGIEPMEYTLEGIEYLASVGVAPTLVVWDTKEGSKFHRHRPPTPDWYVELNEKAMDILFKHGLVDRLLEPPGLVNFYCWEGCGRVGAGEIYRRKLLEDPNWVYPRHTPLSSLRKN